MKVKRVYLMTGILVILSSAIMAQINYQNISNKNFSLGSYGRVGVDWSFSKGGSIGRRLNLNNLGSIGGRLEEQDYLELVPALHFKPADEYSATKINVQLRMAVYSKSLSLMGYSSTSSLGGLIIAFPEIYTEAQNIGNSGLNIWVGSRLYRGADLHIIDHYYFNDHSGQGFGVEYKNTRFCTLFISSSDTTSTLPPYFYLNIESGTSSTALRQRVVVALEHDIKLMQHTELTLLGEYHRMGEINNPSQEVDTSVVVYPSDFGFVLGARIQSDLPRFIEGSYHKLAVRYGTRIANGGDGGMARTWLTYGAPDLDKKNFRNAYSLSLVDELLITINKNHSLNTYVVFTQSMGGADGKGLSKTYHNSEVYNYKRDFSMGCRETYYISDIFHLLSEAHYSQRTEGDNPTYSMVKISLAPTLVPVGKRDVWARPHFRFVSSVAFYNHAAKEAQYSPYLQFVGKEKVGFYFGIKAEWFLWN